MNRTLLVSALLAIALTACGKKEQAPAAVAPTPVPAAAPAPAAPDAAKPADAAAPAAAAPATPAAPAATDKKPEEKKN